MLVVFPPSIRHEEGIAPSFYEDHLLERVSLLELRLMQVTEQLKMAYEFIQREAKTLQKDHILLQSFFESIKKVNPEFADLLSRECMDIYDENAEKLTKQNRRDKELNKILAQHNNKQAELFTHLIEEGIRLLEENEEKQAFRTLERASLLSPKNASLFTFIAKNYFKADKFDAAKFNLEKSFEIEPQNLEILLLLGSIYADEAETEKSRKLLSFPANNPQTMFSVNLVWGMLAAFEKNWNEALAAFKEALNSVETPEIQYLIGCTDFQLEKYEFALIHLKNAVNEDEKFADAWFMQSAIYNILGDDEKANSTLRTAFNVKEAGAQCLEYMKGSEPPNLQIALPFQHFEKLDKRLLTKGSLRLRKFFRKQIFKSIE